MNAELLIKTLMKLMGVSPEQMTAVFNNGQSLIIDAKRRVDTIDARLARIETALGITEPPVGDDGNRVKELTDGRN